MTAPDELAMSGTGARTGNGNVCLCQEQTSVFYLGASVRLSNFDISEESRTVFNGRIGL